MKWDAFLETARRLAQGATEGDWRSAASRAYYAVFHFFQEWLAGQGISLGSGPEAHRRLYHGRLECREGAVQAVARRIDDLRTVRNTADYHLARSFPKPRANTAVQEAEAIVATFQGLLPSVTAAVIIDDFRAYLQRALGTPPPP
jgi:uncharacterized protein (UPF0332 family)